MEYFVFDHTHDWWEIANELTREPNTGKMALLLKELNQASLEFRRVKMESDGVAEAPTEDSEISQIHLNSPQREVFSTGQT